MVSAVEFGTVGYNETETDNTAAFTRRMARCLAAVVPSLPRAGRGGAVEPAVLYCERSAYSIVSTVA